MPRFALRIRYDGSALHGWQAGPGLRSVRGCMAAALARIGEGDPALDAASRTDAGVHALGAVVSATLTRDWQPTTLAHALDGQLDDDLGCWAAAAVCDGWQPGAGATKEYAYVLDLGPARNVLGRAFAWRVPMALDLGLLRSLAELLPGTRTWQAFARRDETRSDLTRSISNAEWQGDATRPRLHITGSGFILHQVRSLVGALVAVASGGCSRADLERALAGERNASSTQMAPACGLFLVNIHHGQHEPAWQGPAATAAPWLPW